MSLSLPILPWLCIEPPSKTAALRTFKPGSFFEVTRLRRKVRKRSLSDEGPIYPTCDISLCLAVLSVTSRKCANSTPSFQREFDVKKATTARSDQRGCTTVENIVLVLAHFHCKAAPYNPIHSIDSGMQSRSPSSLRPWALRFAFAV